LNPPFPGIESAKKDTPVQNRTKGRFLAVVSTTIISLPLTGIILTTTSKATTLGEYIAEFLVVELVVLTAIGLGAMLIGLCIGAVYPHSLWPRKLTETGLDLLTIFVGAIIVFGILKYFGVLRI
jgi:hypothetical protein